jgi:hypothetical protein
MKVKSGIKAGAGRERGGSGGHEKGGDHFPS